MYSSWLIVLLSLTRNVFPLFHQNVTGESEHWCIMYFNCCLILSLLRFVWESKMSLSGRRGPYFFIPIILAVTVAIFRTYNHTDEVIPVFMCITGWNQHRKQLLENCLESLFANTEHSVALHLVVDESSRKEASDMATRIGLSQLSGIKTYQVESIYQDFQREIDLLRNFFGSDLKPYYQKAVFYIAPIVHLIVDEDKLVMLDTDTKVVGDVYDLYDEFRSFNPHQFWGVTYEQSPYYMVVLSQFRANYPHAKLGNPSHSGKPGINSGVLLIDVKKLRQSSSVMTYLSRTHYEFLVDKYMVKGELVLGGQDYLSLMSFEYPELFHFLHCGWNRQLCMWFKENGFSDVFDSYYRCEHEANILHGNCNTTIP